MFCFLAVSFVFCVILVSAIADESADTLLPPPMMCPPFRASATASATGSTTPTCRIQACNGQTVRVSLCPSDDPSLPVTCDGDTLLRVVNVYGGQIAVNDDYCGVCSSLKFQAPASGCQEYTIRQGCHSYNACSGTVGVSFLP